MSDSPDSDSLLIRASAGDAVAWSELVEAHRCRLRRIISLRIDPRLNGVVDASDIIQETFSELHQRLPEYLKSPRLPFFVWLRFLAGDKLARTHRHHLGVQARDAARTVHAGMAAMPDASSVVLSALFVDGQPVAVDQLIRSERQARVEAVLVSMNENDREVLILRHFEDLTSVEAGTILGISESAARKRYMRALERFTTALKGLPGGLAGLQVGF